MGRRRGQTGAGGAVVSSLSARSGGRVSSKDQAKVSGEPQSAGWLGKTPVVFLREWCQRNNRRRPIFQNVKGGNGVMKCVIPAGKRKGSGGGTAFAAVVGIGEKEGEEWAALRVLHQVERGKPLERILPPEFRTAWVELDRCFKEMENVKKKKEFLAQRRKKQRETLERRERQASASGIKVATKDRLAIEDALQGSTDSSSGIGVFSTAIDRKSLKKGSETTEGDGGYANTKEQLSRELVGLGFSPLDAAAAADRFSSKGDALDYLCLNLDEAALPPAFAPRAEFNIVKFSDNSLRPNVSQNAVSVLAEVMAVSRLAAERELRATSDDRDIAKALAGLYRNLTSICVRAHNVSVSVDDVKRAKNEETQVLKAVFDKDVQVGFGAEKYFPASWSAVITVSGGKSLLGSKSPVQVVVVDSEGFYPYTAPVVYVRGRDIPPARRRWIIRAAAQEVKVLRDTNGTSAEPFPVICSVAKFIADISDEQFLNASSDLLGKPSRTLEGRQSLRGRRLTNDYVPKNDTIRRARRHEQPGRVRPSPLSLEMQEMLESRKLLPAFRSRSEILRLVRSHCVVIVSGATGSGKTTQVPQFLLEDAAERGEPINVLCTQPRRIAAISVAQRVSSERCEALGGSVGYQIKLDSRSSCSTRLIFCTTGVLLRRLQNDPYLASLTHVIVDEVHERAAETDFLLVILRDLLQRRPELHVLLMSATLDTTKLSKYFSSYLGAPAPIISIAGRTFPVDEFYLEDAVALSGYSLKPGSRYAKKGRLRTRQSTRHQDEMSERRTAERNGLNRVDDLMGLPAGDNTNSLGAWDDEESESISISCPNSNDSDSDPHCLNNEISDAVSLIDEEMVNIDLIELLIRKITLQNGSDSERGSSILVFLPGLADILSLVERLNRGAGSQLLFPMALHSSLSPEAQSAVFLPAPGKKRKVICSTNIAETSVTVPDVTVVVDTLRAKEMSFDAINSTSVLSEVFISRSSALQRAGRAGRVSRGTCYRLVTRKTFNSRLRANQTPEIRRVSLEHLVLNILSIFDTSPTSFLAKALDPPDADAVSSAVSALASIGAVAQIATDDAGSVPRLTPLGKHLALLPVDAHLGKLMIYGTIFGCLSPALTIAASLSCGSPFISPLDKREESRDAQLRFAWGRSDLLTYARAFEAWTNAGRKASFCRNNFLSQRSLVTIEQQRRLFSNALSDAGFQRSDEKMDVDENSDSGRLLRAVVCAALYPNLARADAQKVRYRPTASGAVEVEADEKPVRLRVRGGERVFIHPASVVFNQQGKLESVWIAFHRKVRTTKDYIRDVSEVSPVSILLFGGAVKVEHEKGLILVGEGRWATFKATAREAVLVRQLRKELDALLEWKLKIPDGNLQERGTALKNAVVKLIKSQR